MKDKGPYPINQYLCDTQSLPKGNKTNCIQAAINPESAQPTSLGVNELIRGTQPSLIDCKKFSLDICQNISQFACFLLMAY